MNMPNPNMPQDPSESSTEPQTMSLLGGVAGDDDMEDFDDEGAGPRLGGIDFKNSGVLLFVIVAVVAAGSIYLMRASQSELTAGDETYEQLDSQIDLALAQLAQGDPTLEDGATQGMFGDTEAVISSLVADLSEKQVPLEYVKKNPFVSTVERQSAERPQNPGMTAEQIRQQRLQQVHEQVERMSLQTVSSGGRGAIAVIDGQMVREGHRVGDFIVRTIHANQMSVELVHEQLNERFILTMQGVR